MQWWARLDSTLRSTLLWTSQRLCEMEMFLQEPYCTHPSVWNDGLASSQPERLPCTATTVRAVSSSLDRGGLSSLTQDLPRYRAPRSDGDQACGLPVWDENQELVFLSSFLPFYWRLYLVLLHLRPAVAIGWQ